MSRWMVVAVLWGSTFVLSGTDWGLRALWPSVVALGTVFLLQRVLVGLLAGAMAGAVLIEGGNPAAGFAGLFDAHLIPVLTGRWNVCAIVFTLLVGGFAALIEHGGGVEAALGRLVGRGRAAARRVEWAAYVSGLLCFFDGLASSVLVGRTMRPLAQRAGVSGAKLSFIVDSTSSPVACVALVSTWIAYQLSLLQENLPADARPDGPYALFLESIPVNFYCWCTLAMVGSMIARRWNIGPMAAAEAMSRAVPEVGDGDGGRSGGLWRALVPVTCLVAGLPAGLLIDGLGRGAGAEAAGGGWALLVAAFGKADAASVLVRVSALACVVAFGCNVRARGAQAASDAFLEGVTRFLLPVLIVVAAWTLGSTLKALGAPDAIAAWLGGGFPAALFPLAVFATGAVISFATGTSWGTMGVLMPLALPAALALGGGAGAHELIVATIAAVFSGAVFGDHCSPVSDTTIVSAMTSGVDTMEHVRTQLPYALLSAGAAGVFGYLPLGLGVPPWICLPVAVGVVLAMPALHGARAVRPSGKEVAL